MIDPEIQNYVNNQIKQAQNDTLYSTKNVAAHFHNGIDSPKLDLTTSAVVAGVSQLTAGSNITLNPSGGTGVVEISATTSSAVSSVTGSGSGILVTPTTGAVVVSNTGVTSLTAGSNIALSSSTGAITISSSGNSFATSTGTIPDVTSIAFTTSLQNNDSVITHGLGTTPKLITVSINQMIVPSSNGVTNFFRTVVLYITFDASGVNASGFTNFSDSSGGGLQAGGNTVSWTSPGTSVQGTITIALVSVGATTFTFRVTYQKNNTNSMGTGDVLNISYLCLG